MVVYIKDEEIMVLTMSDNDEAVLFEGIVRLHIFVYLPNMN